MKARVELYGGPKDGFEGWSTLDCYPGKFPLLVIPGTQGRRYVYQSRIFLEDKSEDKPLAMDFVQIIDRSED